MKLRRLAPLALVPLALAACGQTNVPTSAVNNGVYIEAGPVTYQLEVSRELNRFSTEDRQYLVGLPAGAAALSPSQLWYGVFIWAKNQTSRPVRTASSFDIVDTQGDHYYPEKLNTTLNQWAYRSQSLGPGETAPVLDSTASLGPTQGELLLFKVSDSVYDDRPLTLQILGPSGKVWGSISLDL